MTEGRNNAATLSTLIDLLESIETLLANHWSRDDRDAFHKLQEAQRIMKHDVIPAQGTLANIVLQLKHGILKYPAGRAAVRRQIAAIAEALPVGPLSLPMAS